MALYPLSAYYSTTLTPRISSYEYLADRILRQMGAPLINLEVACSTVFDHISQAIEWYTKYAGHTEEYLIFDSRLYRRGLGIKLDRLFSVTPELCFTENYIVTTYTGTLSTNTVSGITVSAQNYSVAEVTLSALTELSSTIPSSGPYYTVTPTTTAEGTSSTSISSVSGGWDYDLNTYRKVKSVQSFVEGTNAGINSLFTIEQALAQQTYFAYALGNYGFDLITWEVLKQWLDMRERVLAQKVYFRFDPRTQYLRLLPEPSGDKLYYGLIGCKVEKPVKDLISERWVFQYALALTKITIANVRGKFGGTALFGGGSLNANDLMTQGLTEKDKLEQELMTIPGEADPLPFIIG
jgi:hypothetical protein